MSPVEPPARFAPPLPEPPSVPEPESATGMLAVEGADSLPPAPGVPAAGQPLSATREINRNEAYAPRSTVVCIMFHGRRAAAVHEQITEPMVFALVFPRRARRRPSIRCARL